MAESKVRSENFIAVQGWMITELGLKGNELLIYACIYGFSQAENQSFTGSLQYLADWTNSTKQGVIKCLKALVEKGLIVKKENTINGVKFCEYYTTKLNTLLNKVEYPIKQSLTGGSQQSLPNNIDLDNITKNIDKNIKHKHGEYNNVLLTDEELEKLKDEYIDWEERIERLSSYVASTGKKYKSHYATIRNWARKDQTQQKEQQKGRLDWIDDIL